MIKLLINHLSDESARKPNLTRSSFISCTNTNPKSHIANPDTCMPTHLLHSELQMPHPINC
uniref:Uncharacterized protein n=1 Tax=Arundo donax TaxID=35708 RepID=A0A0A9A9I9_ARUDO